MKSIDLKSVLLGFVLSVAVMLVIGAREPGYRGITQYKVVSAHEPSDLNQLVNAALADGWSVQGDVSASLSTGGRLYAQSLVK